MENNKYPFVNLPLPYAYDALEPYIDEKTMQLHHDRHLQGYIDRLNEILEENPDLQALTLEEMLTEAPQLSGNRQSALLHNAGGVYNHRFYFDTMAPNTEKSGGVLLEMLVGQYGNYENFLHMLQSEAQSLQGSGYVWLVFDKGKLYLTTTQNQATPLPQGVCPILALDVWEHAYYLKHYNKKNDYIADWLAVVNWKQANERFLNCIRQWKGMQT